MEQIPDGAFEPFFRDELVASHTGVAGTYWRARFDLNDPVDGLQLVWDLWMNSGQLVRADATEARPLPDLWTKLGLASPVGQATANQPEEPLDMASFSFGVLAAEPTESWSTVLQPAIRRFLAMTGLVVLARNASKGATYSWDRLLRDGIRVLDLDAPLGLRGDTGLFAGSWRYSLQSHCPWEGALRGREAAGGPRQPTERLLEALPRGLEGGQVLRRVHRRPPARRPRRAAIPAWAAASSSALAAGQGGGDLGYLGRPQCQRLGPACLGIGERRALVALPVRSPARRLAAAAPEDREGPVDHQCSGSGCDARHRSSSL